MKNIYVPYLSVVLGIILLPVIMLGSTVDENGVRVMPLLSLLVLNELSFFTAAIGAFIGVRRLKQIGFMRPYALATALCIVLMLVFMFLGTQLWPLEIG